MIPEKFTKEHLRKLYHEEKLSITEVGKRIGVSYSVVRNMFIRYNILIRTRKESSKLYKGWGSWVKGKKRPPFTQEHRRRMSEAKLKAKAKGVTKKPDGYLEFTRGKNKYRGVHRVIMEQYLGRPLTFNDVVHHCDGNRTNNNLSNLKLMTRSEHTSFHRRKELAENGER